ncbi:MAG: permease [Syntrophothermus sp.]
MNSISLIEKIKSNSLSRRLIYIGLFILLWIIIYLNLELLTNSLVYSFLGLNPEEHLTQAIWFFIFEVPKVLLLLTLIVFGIGIIRTYFSPERTRKLLGGKKTFAGNILASLLGVVTPFCSCSAIPLFLGFIEGGVPLGVTFSFLIAAPMINEVALILLFGLFGLETALLYMTTGLLIAITAGTIIGKLGLEKFVEDWVYKTKASNIEQEEEKLNLNDRIQLGITAVKEIVAKVWIYIVVGILVGAGIHGYVPENFMASIMGKSAWWSVPTAVLLGIPMYSNAAGIIPIVQALLSKGASLGTVLAFMMAVIGLSLPEMIILKKVLKIQMIFIFIGIMAVGITIVGYLFNLLY